MSGPDVAGIWAALSTSPHRTPAQVALDEQSEQIARAAGEYSGRVVAATFEEDAADWAVEQLRGVKLSKVARAAVAEALGCEPDDLVA